MMLSLGDYFKLYVKLLFLPCLLSLLTVGKITHVLADMLDNDLILKSQSPLDGWCKITERKELSVQILCVCHLPRVACSWYYLV